MALALKTLPLIDAAFARGEISWSKVRAMTRMATPANEDYLLHIARHGTAAHVEKLVRQYKPMERLSRDDHGKAQQDARQFSYYFDDDGMLCFRGKLAPEDGAVLVKAMEAVLEKMHQETFAREREENDKNVSAETFSRDNAPTCDQKRADALVRLAEQALASEHTLSGGDKYQMVVHINAFQDGGHPHTHACIEDGPVLSAQTVKKLAWRTWCCCAGTITGYCTRPNTASTRTKTGSLYSPVPTAG